MALPAPGRLSLYTGVGVLASVLTNRLFFTPLDSLAVSQSRSDILGVITGATLVLYGVGKAEILDAKPAVDLGGVDVRQGFDDMHNSRVAQELEWAAKTVLGGVQNVRSCAIVDSGSGGCFLGRFRSERVKVQVRGGGVVEGVLEAGERAYLADMRVVPVKEVEFGFLPENCQAVIVQPVSDKVAMILGADKPRPFTGDDFGWLQAIADRLNAVMGTQGVTQMRAESE